MQEQPAIFNESFIAGDYIRRRSLLNTAVKVYTCLSFIIGAALLYVTSLNIIDLIHVLFDPISKFKLLYYYSESYYLERILECILPGIPLFTGPLLIWFESRSAIRFNWLSIAFMCLYSITMLIYNDLFALLFCVPAFLLICPYWIMLFRIQNDWEHKTIHQKDLKQK